MAKTDDNSSIEGNDEQPKLKIKQPPELPEVNEPADTSKLLKNLGNGRWKYHGKTYKEEYIGRK